MDCRLLRLALGEDWIGWDDFASEAFSINKAASETVTVKLTDSGDSSSSGSRRRQKHGVTSGIHAQDFEGGGRAAAA